MTSSIPNSFSSDDLQAMLDSAPKEEELNTSSEETSKSDEDIIDEEADGKGDNAEDHCSRDLYRIASVFAPALGGVGAA